MTIGTRRRGYDRYVGSEAESWRFTVGCVQARTTHWSPTCSLAEFQLQAVPSDPEML